MLGILIMEVEDMHNLYKRKKKSQVLVLTMIILLAMSLTIAACFTIVSKYSTNLKERINDLALEVYKDVNP